MRFPTFLINCLSIRKLSAILTLVTTSHAGKTGGKNLQYMNFKDKIHSSGNLIKIAVNDFVEYMGQFHEEIQFLKGEPLKPDRKTALALLEYISWEESKAKETVETLSGLKIEKYFEWINAYCKEYKCSQEQVLKRIIEGNEQI